MRDSLDIRYVMTVIRICNFPDSKPSLLAASHVRI